MIAPRALLARYPALRESWPVRQARTWRTERSYRQHPRKMASWFRDAPEMHTRICISNLALPRAEAHCHAVTILVTLLDENGARLASKRFHLPRNGSIVQELGELLPSDRRNGVSSGQVLINFEGAELGSSRTYLHWYNDRSLTSSHEKFGLSIPAVAGYWSVPSVLDSPAYRTHLAVSNLDTRPYESTITLKNSNAAARTTRVTIPPAGSRFLPLNELFPDASVFLDDQPGVLFFGNNRQPAMYYYFVLNEERGTWRVQHL